MGVSTCALEPVAQSYSACFMQDLHQNCFGSGQSSDWLLSMRYYKTAFGKSNIGELQRFTHHKKTAACFLLPARFRLPRAPPPDSCTGMRVTPLSKNNGGIFRTPPLTICGSCNRDQVQDPIHADRGGVKLFLGLFNRLARLIGGGRTIHAAERRALALLGFGREPRLHRIRPRADRAALDYRRED